MMRVSLDIYKLDLTRFLFGRPYLATKVELPSYSIGMGEYLIAQPHSQNKMTVLEGSGMLNNQAFTVGEEFYVGESFTLITFNALKLVFSKPINYVYKLEDIDHLITGQTPKPLFVGVKESSGEVSFDIIQAQTTANTLSAMRGLLESDTQVVVTDTQEDLGGCYNVTNFDIANFESGTFQTKATLKLRVM